MDNKWTIPIVILTIIVVIGLAAFAAYASMNSNKTVDSPTNIDSMEKDENNDTMQGDVEEDAMEKNSEEDTEKDDDSIEQEETMKKSEVEGYIDYDEMKFLAASDKKRVIFFHAPWCPSCRDQDSNIESDKDRIPSDVVILKADFDSSIGLRQKYGVTTQHSFVQVDAHGDEIQQWNSLYSEYDLDSILNKI